MKKYYVNNQAQSDGHYEVHNESCAFLHLVESKKYLGDFFFCTVAIKEAKKFYMKVDGCRFCSLSCYKR